VSDRRQGACPKFLETSIRRERRVLYLAIHPPVRPRMNNCIAIFDTNALVRAGGKCLRSRDHPGRHANHDHPRPTPIKCGSCDKPKRQDDFTVRRLGETAPDYVPATHHNNRWILAKSANSCPDQQIYRISQICNNFPRYPQGNIALAACTSRSPALSSPREHD
jgi:hypothetical protein